MKRTHCDLSEHQCTRKKLKSVKQNSPVDKQNNTVNKKRKLNSSPSPEKKNFIDSSTERSLCKRQFERRFLNKGYFYNEEVEYIC